MMQMQKRIGQLLVLVAAVMGMGFSQAEAAPAQVIIIRHAEKLLDGSEDLSERGLQRAQALVGFFSTNPEAIQFGPPAAIYASRVKPGGSIRTIQTVQPLADHLGLQVRSEFKKSAVGKIADDIMNDQELDGKTVVISWHHEAIPDLAQAFGCDSAPSSWSSDVFDRAWVIRFKGEAVSSFENLPQNILPGDSAR